MDMDRDQPLIDLTKQGNISAYEQLVDRYKNMVFTLALRLVGNKEEAEEVTQDTFLKVYDAISNFKGDSKFSTWLYKIAYHKSLDYIKKIKTQPRTNSLDGSYELDFQLMNETWNSLESKEKRRNIKKAIERLEGEDGLLITLFYFEELTLKEIANITDLEANTVKVRLHRARKKLALILKNTLEPETIKCYERAGK
ncbi:sigma-70 family RNA polymerase sigma factor [Maribacter sp. PR1]|uniref:RNA polymerase sigma factor n=1 Tax=Maribacter cobaltidurans TaxID=1178778 RepID=A0ABU7IWV3_9FLAO|nr:MULTISPECIES: sigma-70 family RNA polymerase sigma factor [Maribacter]MDC6390057.1 sigma-70 family RNA polymerase sigma factor [Maribacter sp. PR1]MEE1977447.1 sigma-70 family RNA polymerase sigma factor [Maribacter cobaltidurans]